MGSGHETQAAHEHPPQLGLWTPSHPSKAPRPQLVVFCFCFVFINTHSRVVSLGFFNHFRHSHGRSSTYPPNSPGRWSMSIEELQPSEGGSRGFKNQWKAPSALPAAHLPAVTLFLKLQRLKASLYLLLLSAVFHYRTLVISSTNIFLSIYDITSYTGPLATNCWSQPLANL